MVQQVRSDEGTSTLHSYASHYSLADPERVWWTTAPTSVFMRSDYLDSIRDALREQAPAQGLINNYFALAHAYPAARVSMDDLSQALATSIHPLNRVIARLRRLNYPARFDRCEFTSDTEVTPRPSLYPIIEQLATLANLPANWDSYDAEPISPRAITAALHLTRSIYESFSDLLGEQVRPFAIAPVADGGILVEWRAPEGALEIEVGPDGRLGYLLVEGREPQRRFEEGDSIPWTQVADLMRRLTANESMDPSHSNS